MFPTKNSSKKSSQLSKLRNTFTRKAYSIFICVKKNYLNYFYL